MEVGDTFKDEEGREWQIEYVGRKSVKLRQVNSFLSVAWFPVEDVKEMLLQQVKE